MIGGVSVRGADRTRANLVSAAGRLRAAQESSVKRASILVSRMLREELTEPAVSDPFWGKVGSRGDGLSVRTGHTRASITGGGTIFRVGSTVSAAVGSPSKSLLQHESGGTFGGGSPGGYHRIPTREAQTAAGADRYAGASIRDIPGSFLLRSLGGKLWAAVTRGRGKSAVVTLLYLLAKTITLKPRRIFKRTSAHAAPQIAGGLRIEVSQIASAANR